MKAVLEFDLPQDSSEHMDALNGCQDRDWETCTH